MIEAAALRRLSANEDFQAFMVWLSTQAGLYAVETNDARRVFADGKRALLLDALTLLDNAQPGTAANSMPARAAIQLAQAALQIAAKEKNLERRSSDDTDGDDGAE